MFENYDKETNGNNPYMQNYADPFGAPQGGGNGQPPRRGKGKKVLATVALLLCGVLVFGGIGYALATGTLPPLRRTLLLPRRALPRAGMEPAATDRRPPAPAAPRQAFQL